MDYLNDFIYDENELTALDLKLKEKEKHRKSRKGRFKAKEKECLRGFGSNLISSQCLYNYKTFKYRRSGDWPNINIPANMFDIYYFSTSFYENLIYFYNKDMLLLASFSFSDKIYDFFVEDNTLYEWAPYKKKFEKYIGESFESALNRIYPVRTSIEKKCIGFKNRHKYEHFKKLKHSSKWLDKTEYMKKYRTLEKQYLDKIKKLDNYDDFDIVFPLKPLSDYSY